MLHMEKELSNHSLCNISAIKNTVFDDLKVVSIIGIWEVWKKKYFRQNGNKKNWVGYPVLVGR